MEDCRCLNKPPRCWWSLLISVAPHFFSKKRWGGGSWKHKSWKKLKVFLFFPRKCFMDGLAVGLRRQTKSFSIIKSVFECLFFSSFFKKNSSCFLFFLFLLKFSGFFSEKIALKIYGTWNQPPNNSTMWKTVIATFILNNIEIITYGASAGEGGPEVQFFFEFWHVLLHCIANPFWKMTKLRCRRLCKIFQEFFMFKLGILCVNIFICFRGLTLRRCQKWTSLQGKESQKTETDLPTSTQSTVHKACVKKKRFDFITTNNYHSLRFALFHKANTIKRQKWHL